jgi:hypothetical protein
VLVVQESVGFAECWVCWRISYHCYTSVLSDVALCSWLCDVRREYCRLGSIRWVKLLEVPLVGVVVGDEFFRFGR